jgi:hypothetical protein
MTDRSKKSRTGSKNETPLDVRFVRVPSIAERKLGADYVAPMRLDPRVLDQMQTTIKGLEARYGDALREQLGTLLTLVEPACGGDTEARGRLYAIVHDMRGLAGTFGHPMVGRFANSLCGYIENAGARAWQDDTVFHFHLDAIREALDSPGADPAITLETLNALQKLIAASTSTRRLQG